MIFIGTLAINFAHAIATNHFTALLYDLKALNFSNKKKNFVADENKN